ncbi:MAG: HisA/HisF-related TIM barrel protein, partial [Planctomycetota bacterium]
MIIPSIDLQNGKAIQLVGGETLAIDAGDPHPIAERFAIAGEIAVIDLDAAMGKGDNRDLIKELIASYPCRVGGGIRTAEQAWEWLELGATKVILGTAAKPEILSQLPKDQVIAALDARQGEIHVRGWQEATGRRIEDEMRRLEPLVGGFLVTFIESEGRMQGTQLEYARRLAALAGKARLTIAGGVSAAEEIAALDQAGMDAQVGMAIYRGDLSLAAAIAAPLTSDRPDGLWPTVVCDEIGRALGLCYSNHASLEEACKLRRGVYHSRKRGLWIKGESSGASQDLLRVDLDCDRDCLRFIVRQRPPGFC